MYDREFVIDYNSFERNDLMVFSAGYYEQKHIYTAWGERMEQLTERGSWDRLLYVHEDIMGNTRYYTKDNGQSFAELEYDVWGAVTSPSKLTNNDNGNFAAAVFTGHPYDTVLDIYFAEARFYDANHRQWMSVDPIKSGLNWYLYCYANPATYWDPDGWEAIIIGTDVITDVSVINGKIYADMNDVAKAYGGTAQMKQTANLSEPDVTWNIPDGAGKTITATYDTGIFKINGQNVQRDSFKPTYSVFMKNDPSGRVLVDTQYFSKLVCASSDNSYHEVWWYGKTPSYMQDETLKEIIDEINQFGDVIANPVLAWNQTKINELWRRSENYLLQYGVDLDPRLVLAIIRVEGTGSFNTNLDELAGDGGGGIQTNFDADVSSANALLYGKLLGYIHYKDQFQEAVQKNNDGTYPYITGEGDIFQYMNWQTPRFFSQSPWYPSIKNYFESGVYAENVYWYNTVIEKYNLLTIGSIESGVGEGADLYAEYAKTIPASVADKILGANYKYTEFDFVLSDIGKFNHAAASIIAKTDPTRYGLNEVIPVN